MKKPSRKFHFFSFQMLLVFTLNAQNLVPNYSFEDHTQCPTQHGQLDFCASWYNPANNTPDYFNSCSNGGEVGVPFNFVGYQEAITGEGYAGILGPTAREYIQAKLLESLDTGQCYYVEMFISAGFDNSIFCLASSHMGIYLSSSPPSTEPNGIDIFTTPQFFYTEVVNDTLNWTPLGGAYIAEGGEQYITIGHFFENGYNTEVIDPGCEFPLYSYYFIENVRVEQIFNDEIFLEAQICEGDCYTYLGNQYCDEGTYQIPVNEPCYSTVNLTIIYGEPTIADIEEPDLLTCEELSIFLDASGSSGGVNYSWQGPNNFTSNEQNPEVFDPGVYTLIVSDGGLCSSEASVEVFEELIPPDISTEVDGITDCNGLPVTLTGSSNTPNVTYHWSGPGVDTNLPITTTTQIGTYIFIVTTIAGCTSSEAVIVEGDFEAPDINAEVNGIIDCNGLPVTLTGSSNTPNVIYHWSGPGVDANTPSATVNLAGTYILTVTAPNGCVSNEEVVVFENFEPPDIFVEVIGELGCNNSLVTLAGGSSTPGVSYNWTGPGVFTDQPITSTDQAGFYTFTVIGSNGCVSSEQVEVEEENAVLDIDATVDGMLNCIDTMVTLTGSTTAQDVTYQWTGPGIDSEDPVIEVDQPGDYTFSILTDNGCAADTTILVEQNIETPEIIFGIPDTLNCNILFVDLDASTSSGMGILDFEWQNENGDILGNSAFLNVNTGGSYTLILMDEENGCSEQSTIDVFEDLEEPVTIIEAVGMLDCQNSLVTLDGSSSTGNLLNFQWLDENDEVISNDTSVDVSMQGIYSLLVTNTENGCSFSASIEVESNMNLPVVMVESSNDLNCDDHEATLDGNGSSEGSTISYEWQNHLGDSISSNLEITVDLPGTYTLIVTDTSNNCSTSATIEVSQDIETPVANSGNDAILNCQLTEITLDGSQSSSGTNFNYQWLDSNNNVVSGEITTLVNQPDTYTLVVTNTENGCSSASMVVIDQNIDTPQADAGQDGTLYCNSNEVTLDGSASSGNNLSFQWFNESGALVGIQSMIQVSETGVFILILTNTESECTSQSSVEVIPDDSLPTAVADTDGILTCENTQVIIDGSASTSVSGNISFEWQDEVGNIISILENVPISSPGDYTLIVTDTDNGCSISTTVEVQQDIESPIADAGQNQILTCSQTNVTLDGSGSSGVNLGFEWQDEMGNTIALTAITTVSSGGIYFLIVTNTQTGCSASESVEVTPDTNLPVANAGIDQLLTCSITQIMLDGTASSTGPNIEYEWQNEIGTIVATTQTTIITTAGTYTLIVLDTANNCLTQDEVVVGEDIELPIPVIDFVSNQEIDCNNSSIVLDATGSVPFGILSFEWTTNDGEIILGVDTPNPELGQAGTYSLIVTNNENGCTASETIEIVENLGVPEVVINPPQTLSCVTTTIEIDASSSPTGNFTYSWISNPVGGIVSGQASLQPTVNQAGTYILTIINNDNGCETSAQIEVLQDITPPTAVANSDEEFDCITESITLSGDGSSTGPQFSYQWFGNGAIDNNMSLNPIIYEVGSYTLEVTNNDNGCTQTAEILVMENQNEPTAAQTLVNDPLCFGQTGSLSILEVTGGEQPYLYSIDGGQNFSLSGSFSSLQGGDYTVIIQDVNGCEYEQTIFIEPATQINVELEPEVVLELGQDYQVNVFSSIDTSQIAQIIWSPTDGLSCTNCLDPTIEQVLTEIQYSISIIDHNGCQATDQIMLRVDKTREIFIPNAFSPNNGDGINDIFMIFANNDKIRKVNTFQVYDRWGEQVFLAENFQPNDPVFGWNGKLNEKDLNPAVFVYFAEIEFIDGVKIIYKGDVALME